MKMWCLFLCLIPKLLSAGIFDWFFPEEEPVITQFECPYNCGGVGSEGLERLEIQAMRVLWELNRFNHALQNKLLAYEPPQSFSDSWAEELQYYQGIDMKLYPFHIGIERAYNVCHRPFYHGSESSKYSCGCIDFSRDDEITCWYLEKCYSEDELYLGKLFWVFRGYYESNGRFRNQDSECFDLADPFDIGYFQDHINMFLEEAIQETHKFYSWEIPWIEDRVENYRDHLEDLKMLFKEEEGMLC